MARRRLSHGHELIALKQLPEKLVSATLDRLPATLKSVVTRSRDNDVLLFAGSLAFHALVSVAPLTIVVLWLASLIVGDSEIEQAASELKELAPAGLSVGDALKRVAELGTEIGLPSLIAALWPATAYGAGLRRGFARLAGEEKSLKGLRGRGLVLLVLLPMFVLGALLSSYLASALVDWEGPGRVVAVGAALLAAFTTGAVAIGLIYRIFPSRSLSAQAILGATLWTSGAISVISLLFTWYLSAGANFQEHYATSGVAGIVLLGVWLFLSNAILLMGFELALEREQSSSGGKR